MVGEEKVRVAQLGPAPDGPGGMPAVMRALLRSSLAQRYRLDVIPTYRDRRPLRRMARFAAALAALVRWCAGRGPRIVHVHMAARGSMYRKAAVVAVAKAMRRPVVLHVHAGPGDLAAFFGRLGPLRRWVLRGAFRAADRLLSVSASSAAALRELPLEREIVVVPNAPPTVPPFRARPPREAVTILYLGGFANPIKGGVVLVEALPALLRRRPDCRVLLAGPGEPPDGLPQGAEWIGWLDEAAKERAFGEADLFVMPSLSEGLPVALLEAMANGLAIVATRAGGIPEAVDDGVEALLVEPGDAASLANGLAGLAEDLERRRELGMAAAERVRRLAEDDVYGRLDRLYAELSGRAAPA